MKKLLVLTATILLFCTPHYGQIDSMPVKKIDVKLAEHFHHKSTQERKAGFILLGGGVAVGAIAVAIFPKDIDLYSGSIGTAAFSWLLFTVGAAAVITSLPMFIASAINGHKARILINRERVELSPQLKTSQWQMKTGLAISF
jgi:hypothetical protein